MKKFFKTFTLLSCMLFLTIYVSAHSGSTDSNGGHTNNSTGEYHYHHGYSAHDHYDMDGDGDLDCPYEFDDKTNHNSSSTGSNSSNNSSSSNASTKNDKDKITFWDVVIAVILLIPFSLLTLYILYIVLALICIMIEWFVEKCFKIRIEESKMNRILHILIIIGLVILIPIELLYMLKML